METGVLMKNRYRTAYLQWDDIFYIVRDLRRVLVYTADDEYWEYRTINSIVILLDERFYQCHKGLMVNLDKLRSVEDDHAVLVDGRSIHMCRSFLQKTKKELVRYHRLKK